MGCFLFDRNLNPVLIGVGERYGIPQPMGVLPFESDICGQVAPAGASCQTAQSITSFLDFSNRFNPDVQDDASRGPKLAHAAYDIDSNYLVMAFDKPIWWGNNWEYGIMLHTLTHETSTGNTWLEEWKKNKTSGATILTSSFGMTTWLGEWDGVQILANVLVSRIPDNLEPYLLSDTLVFLGVTVDPGVLVDADGNANEFDLIHVMTRDTQNHSRNATNPQNMATSGQVPDTGMVGRTEEQTLHVANAEPGCPVTDTGVIERAEDRDPAAEWKSFMLDIINNERQNAGLDPVILGDNTAAQVHADGMLATCTASHWGDDGLKPYMRYTLAGGYQYNAENISGLDYCIKPYENYAKVSLRQHIQDTMSGFMSSPGHRDNILDPHHTIVNLGIAWDDYNVMIAQHFEYGYVCFEDLPDIQDNILSFSAIAQGSATFSDPALQLRFDPPPRELTRGQLAQTYCYDNGLAVADIRPPPPPGASYLTNSYHSTEKRCPDPYDILPGAPAPGSVQEAYDAYQDAYNLAQLLSPHTTTVPFLEADRWTHTGDSLSMSVDIAGPLRDHGPGVYTLILWGTVEGELVPVSSYSIFYQTDLPPYIFTLDMN